ncbi:MAG: protein-glutamate O-methyltransferase CheR [Thermodesulfobacteriota bacterium]
MSIHSSFLRSPEFTEADFIKISRLVYEQSGINLSDSKKELVKARLGKRIRKGRFQSFGEYYRHVVNDRSGEEIIQLLDSISTNFTQFFREKHHFEYLVQHFLPQIREREQRFSKKIRIWSAGCSSGEEPYSIAITLLESLSPVSDWNLSILATDISTKVLGEARGGVYLKEKIHDLQPNLMKKYFLRGQGRWQQYVKVKSEVKSIVHFQRFNLMDSFSFNEPFDCIFCRNVMIYFDKKTREQLVNRLYDHLAKEGVLFIGHSESLTGIDHAFHYIKPAVYRK